MRISEIERMRSRVESATPAGRYVAQSLLNERWNDDFRLIMEANRLVRAKRRAEMRLSDFAYALETAETKI